MVRQRVRNFNDVQISTFRKKNWERFAGALSLFCSLGNAAWWDGVFWELEEYPDSARVFGVSGVLTRPSLAAVHTSGRSSEARGPKRRKRHLQTLQRLVDTSIQCPDLVGHGARGKHEPSPLMQILQSHEHSLGRQQPFDGNVQRTCGPI